MAFQTNKLAASSELRHVTSVCWFSDGGPSSAALGWGRGAGAGAGVGVGAGRGEAQGAGVGEAQAPRAKCGFWPSDSGDGDGEAARESAGPSSPQWDCLPTQRGLMLRALGLFAHREVCDL